MELKLKMRSLVKALVGLVDAALGQCRTAGGWIRAAKGCLLTSTMYTRQYRAEAQQFLRSYKIFERRRRVLVLFRQRPPST